MSVCFVCVAQVLTVVFVCLLFRNQPDGARGGHQERRHGGDLFGGVPG